MFKNPPAVWLVPIFLLSGIATAQNIAPVTPVAEASRAPALGYRSAFEGYKPYTDDKLQNWREVNDSAGRIGGWRAYAREAAQPEGKAPAHDMATMPDPKTGGSKP